jgi:hypothetical protein
MATAQATVGEICTNLAWGAPRKWLWDPTGWGRWRRTGRGIRSLVFEEKRVYVRTEKSFYCIGE